MADRAPRDGEVLAVLRASGLRRWLAVATLVALGGLLAWLALDRTLALHWRLSLAFPGPLSVWVADRLRRATGRWLVLTESDLRDSSGRILARISDVEKVERGPLAFRPSNGFTLTTRIPQAWAWEPGLWWRFGRRVAVGGVTAGAHANAMADRISAILAERER